MTVMDVRSGSGVQRTTRVGRLGSTALRPAPRLAERRERWLQASAEVTRQLLAVDGPDPLAVIAERVLDLAEADIVTVVVPTADGAHVMVEVAAGESSEQLVGAVFAEPDSLSGRAIRSGEPAVWGDTTKEWLHLSTVLPVGHAVAIPLNGAVGVRGALVAGRRTGRARFTTTDLEMTKMFANQAALALEVADAQEARQRLAVLKDRARIAEDLHDHVIQRLFAASLSLQALTNRDAAAGAEIDDAVSGINDTILQLRTSIFGLRSSGAGQSGTVRERVLRVISETAPLLPCAPHAHFVGPVDTLVDDDDFADDIVAVVREALTNVGKHARASLVELRVTAADGGVTVVIADNGVGVPAGNRRSGLDNMRRRAADRGGRLTVEPAATGSRRPGTVLTWTAVLP